MPPEISPPATQNTARLQALLHELHRELGPRVQRADHPRAGSLLAEGSLLAAKGSLLAAKGSLLAAEGSFSRHPTGLRSIDERIGGGFPVGCLSEISGSTSSGRTTLVLALLAQATRSGVHVAWVDRADVFDPSSAEAAGVILEHVLWVRAQQTLAALRCTERILATEGFALVVLDLTRPHREHHPSRDQDQHQARGPSLGRHNKNAPIPRAAWLRLARLTAGKQNTLILLSDQRLAGSRAALALEMQPAIARFTGTPALLETLETRAQLVRHHHGQSHRQIQSQSQSQSPDHSAHRAA